MTSPNKILRYVFIAVTTYYIATYFEKKIKANKQLQDSNSNFRGGDSSDSIITKVTEVLLKDTGVRAGFAAVIITATLQHFKDQLAGIIVSASIAIPPNTTIPVYTPETQIIQVLLRERDLLDGITQMHLIKSLAENNNKLTFPEKVSLCKIMLKQSFQIDSKAKLAKLVVILILMLVFFFFNSTISFLIFLNAILEMIKEGNLPKALKPLIILTFRKNGIPIPDELNDL